MHAVVTSLCPAYSRHTHTHLFTDMQSCAHAQVARIPGVKNLVVMGSQALTGTKPVWYSIYIVHAAYVTCPENMAPLLPPTTTYFSPTTYFSNLLFWWSIRDNDLGYFR